MDIPHPQVSANTNDYAALLKQRRQLDAQLEELRADAIAQFKQRILAEAEELDVDVRELFASDAKRSRASRGVSEIRYRDPENPDNVWSGRGRPPKWMQDQIDAGRDKDAFAT